MARVWVPLVVLVVISAAAFGVYRLHGVFGSTNINQAIGIKDDSKNIIPKDIVYEIFGPAGTKGEVNYLDDRAQPQRAQFTTLPWTLTITTTMTSVFANVVAMGDSDEIGCRILSNGEVKDEQTVSNHNAQVFCMVKSA
ncbi:MULTISPECIES: MmpS family transport accessory protein [Mycobacteriaceae]|uniref:MmpS family transport accessory protein n=1 Tax=Mycobacteriaceae TaxID=1762 RepID=UPI0009940C40|nr:MULTISPECIES: MmpS family transport accessory protein [Mycobacteriaceae]